MRNKMQLLKNVIEPPYALPLLGSAHLFCGKSTEELFTFMKIAFKPTQDQVMKAWIGPVLIVFLGNAEDAHIFLNSQHTIEKQFFYQFFENTGLFSGPGKRSYILIKPIHF